MLQQISGEHYRHWLLFSEMQAEVKILMNFNINM